MRDATSLFRSLPKITFSVNGFMGESSRTRFGWRCFRNRSEASSPRSGNQLERIGHPFHGFGDRDRHASAQYVEMRLPNVLAAIRAVIKDQQAGRVLNLEMVVAIGSGQD